MVGKTVGELSPFKDIESNKVMLERLQKDGYVRYEDLPLETRDGRHIAVEFVSNVYQAGDSKVIQCNIRDITERKQARKRNTPFQRGTGAARRRAHGATASRQRGTGGVQLFRLPRFARAAAPVMGFVELLQKDAGPSLSERTSSI